MTISQAIRTLIGAAENRPGRKKLARILHGTDQTGHSLLCRLLEAIANFGPHGKFVMLSSIELKTGGCLCSFGVQCGDPTKDYLRHSHEVSEEFYRITRMLTATGALQEHIWENSQFAVASLCKCGKNDECQFPLHDPLCPYRVAHHIPVTINEYKEAIGRVIH